MKIMGGNTFSPFFTLYSRHSCLCSQVKFEDMLWPGRQGFILEALSVAYVLGSEEVLS
jgi:hypothetical protein